MEVACEERDRFAAHDRTQNTKAPPRVRTTGLVLTDGAVSINEDRALHHYFRN